MCARTLLFPTLSNFRTALNLNIKQIANFPLDDRQHPPTHPLL